MLRTQERADSDKTLGKSNYRFRLIVLLYTILLYMNNDIGHWHGMIHESHSSRLALSTFLLSFCYRQRVNQIVGDIEKRSSQNFVGCQWWRDPFKIYFPPMIDTSSSILLFVFFFCSIYSWKIIEWSIERCIFFVDRAIRGEYHARRMFRVVNQTFIWSLFQKRGSQDKTKSRII